MATALGRKSRHMTFMHRPHISDDGGTRSTRCASLSGAWHSQAMSSSLAGRRVAWLHPQMCSRRQHRIGGDERVANYAFLVNSSFAFRLLRFSQKTGRVLYSVSSCGVHHLDRQQFWKRRWYQYFLFRLSPYAARADSKKTRGGPPSRKSREKWL